MDKQKIKEHRELLQAVREMIFEALYDEYGRDKVIRRNVGGEAVITLVGVNQRQLVSTLKRVFR